jgi:hypothetical protein
VNGARLAATLTLLLTLPAGAQEILDLPAYREQIAELHRELSVPQIEAARTRAQALLTVRLRHAGEELQPDPSLIEPVSRLADPSAAPALARHARRLLETLDEARGATPQPIDAGLLKALALRQAPARPRKGGQVIAPPTLSIPERLEAALGWLAQVVRRGIEHLVDLVAKLFPSRRRGKPEAGGGVAPLTIALVAVLVVALAALAAHTVLRARRAARPVLESEPMADSRRDADPLSREASEWESYARQLAEAGRCREAIRAHYHALLVTLFRAGVLHHQAGRTNWEYVTRLSVELRWRPEFVEATREFDQEWYGNESSSAEALDRYARRSHRLLASLGETAR